MKNFFLILLALSALSGCESVRKASNQNLSGIYRRDASVIHPQFSIFHQTDSTSEFYFKVNSKELLYTKEPNSTDFTAQLLVSYQLAASFESPQVIDSASVKFTDMNNLRGIKDITGELRFKAAIGKTYLLEVTITDMNRNQSSKSYINIDKSNRLNKQNFMVRLKDTDVPLFNDYVQSGQKLSVTYNTHAPKLFVHYYKRDFPLAAPPFSLDPVKPFEYQADSSFTLILNENNSADIKLTREGFYHFQADTTKKEGLTLYKFYDEFPEIKTAEHLTLPLRYINSKQEYDDLINNKNKKGAVDNFWLKAAGSPERAKEIIRKFYNRVRDSNIYFTSYLEGWKTDRGMIYIIYGSPNVIYKNSFSETWTYGEENNFMSLNYTFTKVTNPFSDNDYILDRSSIYKNSWSRAVDIWRQGRVYLEN